MDASQTHASSTTDPSDESGPATAQSLTAELRELGVRPGSTVIVHTALSKLGWVVGGEIAVLAALRAAVGPDGTLVMPVQSWQLCDPAFLGVPDQPSWWPTIRDHLPVYDPASTPSKTMGLVAELFRTSPGTLRSAHPHRSFAAAGPNAATVVARHDLDSPTGERSPLSALYDLRADVLLLGVGADKCTALHLAEDRLPPQQQHYVENGAALLADGRRTWRTWQEPEAHDEDFPAVAAAFAADTGAVRTGPIGRATATLLPMAAFVDYAVDWFGRTRPAAAPGH